MNKIIQGDCLEKLKELADNSVDSIITDPPYELGFMGKQWDNTGIANNVEMWAECLRVLKPGGHLLSFGGTRTYHRMAVAIEDAGFEIRDMIEWVYSTGFPKSLNVFKQLKKKCECGNMEVYENRTKQMGASSEQEAKYFLRFMQEKDLSQTKSFKEKQGEILQSGLSEQSTHRTVQREEPKESSIRGEERILERRDNLQKTEGKLQRSDLPEMSEGISTDGEERRIYNATQTGNGSTSRQTINENGSGASRRPQSEQQQYREPCAFCKQWGTQAIRTLGVGTATKPAHEPICMARKPLAEKTVAENCLKWGTGGINIDESRVETTDDMKETKYPAGRAMCPGGGDRNTPEVKIIPNSLGRFPANLLHDNSEEVRECFPNESERFFKSIIYQAKASKSERNKGLYNTAIVLIEWSIWNEKHTTQEVKKAELLVDMGILQPKDTEESGIQPSDASGWNTLLFGKSLTAKYQKDIKSIILTETSSTTTSQIYSWLALLLTKEYTVDVSSGMANGGNLAENAELSKVLVTTMSEVLASRLGVKNAVLGTQLKISVKEGRSGHPTVKPIALMEYLIKMVTPKGGVVLDPFAGSGSTLIAARQNGFQYIGIELTEEYIPIIEARLKAVQERLL